MRAFSQDQRRRARTRACRIPALLGVQSAQPNSPELILAEDGTDYVPGQTG
jgi:hypothetical protein